MDDHLFFTVGGVLDSGLWCLERISHVTTWNVLADQAKPLSSDNQQAVSMLAIGTGGLDVTCSQVSLIVKCQKLGIKLVGKPNWVSAKDIVLEMLRRYNAGGRGYILEYYGPGLKRSAHGIVMSSLIWVQN
jgi:aconitate hydratase